MLSRPIASIGRGPPLRLRVRQHARQRLARQRPPPRALRAAGSPASAPPRLGNAASSDLAEAVDRLDAHAPARRIEHPREQRPRALLHRRRRPLAERVQVLRPAPSRGIRTQAASRSLIRCAISAAPALVKVRHRIAAGSTPRSNSRNTRAASTCVLPVPADADSQTCESGSLAAACAPSSEAAASASAHGHTIRRAASAGRIRHRARIRAPAWR